MLRWGGRWGDRGAETGRARMAQGRELFPPLGLDSPAEVLPPELELERWENGLRKDVSRPQAEVKHPPRQEAAHFRHSEDCGLSMKGQEKEGRGETRSLFTPS